ncbi:MAG: pentapeptide repeat-containing protein [Chloroflexi bacterium]|nr:pentapeptide repeat-containing protein [Chloroflexota bacterium]
MAETTPEKKPLTRDDVLRRREEFLESYYRQGWHDCDDAQKFDSEAQFKFDLSGEHFEEHIDLSQERFVGYLKRDAKVMQWTTRLWGARLHKAFLSGAQLQGAFLSGSQLQGAYLSGAQLQGASLSAAQLQGADLSNADLRTYEKSTNLEGAQLQGAYLMGAQLQGACLLGAQLQGAHLQETDLQGAALHGADLSQAKIEGVHWGDYKVGEEIGGLFEDAEAAYRHLKQCHTQAGLYDVAGEFHYREWECKRKGLPWRKNPLHKLWLSFTWLATGHMEKPERVVLFGLFTWLSFAALYLALGLLWGLVPIDVGHVLYVSAVSFTAVGYGPWLSEEHLVGGAQGVAAFEALVGVFSIALFLTVFVRKMTR